jgi:hypothetical protein
MKCFITSCTRKATHFCVFIEGAPHENKMARKGQMTSERARKR